VIPTFVIGLREGVEASLVVGIVAAFLRHRGRWDAIRWVWVGVGLATALCLVVAFGLQALNRNLPHREQETLEAVVALVAVGMVSYMILWMRGHARNLKGMLEESTATAIAQGSVVALVGMAFFAVLREGFETTVFLLAAFQNSVNPGAASLGALLGLVLAVGLGYAIYRGGVRINLARFFRLTGFVLVLVAAGLVASAIHAGHEAGWINALQAQALDLRWLVGPGTVRAALITGVLGIQPQPTAAEILGYLLYAVPMAMFVLWPSGPRVRKATVPAVEAAG
jgi:high-affinity iron transporter